VGKRFCYSAAKSRKKKIQQIKKHTKRAETNSKEKKKTNEREDNNDSKIFLQFFAK